MWRHESSPDKSEIKTKRQNVDLHEVVDPENDPPVVESEREKVPGNASQEVIEKRDYTENIAANYPKDFLASEDLGVGAPCRCPACRGCKDCS